MDMLSGLEAKLAFPGCWVIASLFPRKSNVMKRIVSFPNPAIAIELMSLVVAATSALAASVLWSAVTTDNWYLDHINAFIAGLMALLAGHRLYLGVGPRLARGAWIATLVLFVALAVIAPFEGAM